MVKSLIPAAIDARGIIVDLTCLTLGILGPGLEHVVQSVADDVDIVANVRRLEEHRRKAGRIDLYLESGLRVCRKELEHRLEAIGHRVARRESRRLLARQIRVLEGPDELVVVDLTDRDHVVLRLVLRGVDEVDTERGGHDCLYWCRGGPSRQFCRPGPFYSCPSFFSHSAS